jgi:uncharacterized small protein (DUF1192 family)
MSAIDTISDNRLRLRLLNDEINKLERQAKKKEEDGFYPSDLYAEIDRLENKRAELEAVI